MRYAGRITEWNDDRGFGFVVPNGGGDRAFVHVTAFARQPSRPATGLPVSYELVRDGKGRLNACAVRPATASSNRRNRSGDGTPRTVIAALFLGVLATGWLFNKVPAILVLAYALMSALALLIYGIDKSAARNNRWRTQESTLHLVALFGGWPGALLAQSAFRHKSSKAEFQSTFWITVVLNCAGLAWLLASGAATTANQAILGP